MSSRRLLVTDIRQDRDTLEKGPKEWGKKLVL